MKTCQFKISAIIYLLAIFGLTFSELRSQSAGLPLDEETGLITYKEVVEESGNKQEFFNRAIAWINEYYPNPVDVTKVRDPQSGLIKGLHRFKIRNTDSEGLVTDAGVIQYEFTLEFKEGRYRYILTEFVLRQSSKIPVEKWLNKDDPQYNPQWEDYLDQVKDFAESWIKSLKEGMKAKPEKKDDEW
jgi:hypothetical protein